MKGDRAYAGPLLHLVENDAVDDGKGSSLAETILAV
jgi:hypothetical protein